MSILRNSCLGVLAVLATGAFLTACSGDDQAEIERAQRAEIRDERREAARAARQDERIKQLEREAAAAKRQSGGESPPTTGPVTTTDTGTHVSTGADSWPEGTTAWTVVLASTGARGEAESVAARAGSAGLGQVGVLFSSNYSSLHDGYWVAYTGVLSQAEARTRQDEARGAGFGDAYAREVSP